ncbi:Gfo/Idh/MocA family oxidoreductase [Propionibacteriaceae bacterium Y1685]
MINSRWTDGPLRVILVGAGHRTLRYAEFAQQSPDAMQVVGVVDPDPIRREQAAALFSLGPDQQWNQVEELPAEPAAHAAINGTMDALHVATTKPLIDRGLDVLLEKPIALDAASLLDLQRYAEAAGRRVLICHVLRHAPFYRALRERVAAGEIGDVVTIQMSEQVAYDHMATAFVRGKWANSEQSGSSILLAKCCHDLDLMSWFMAPARPVRATSAGGLSHFRRENAPAGAGTRCLTDCAIEKDCAYSARRIGITLDRWEFYLWESIEDQTLHPTREQKEASLSGDNPYGRCVWHSDNDVADHQTAVVEFDNGATASLTLTGTASRGSRTIHIVGTRGELQGTMEDNAFTVRTFDADPSVHHRVTEVTLETDTDFHGGGDLRLVADFVAVLRGEQPSLSTTELAASVDGHLAGFAAEQSRLDGRWVELADLRAAV